MTRGRRIRSIEQAMEGLILLLGDVEGMVDVVVVEGARDVEALRSLGFRGYVEVFSQLGVSDADFTASISGSHASVLLLTDFDEEGRKLDLHLSMLLERGGVRVERGLRRRVGRLMAAIGVYAIEDLDNVNSNLERLA